MSPLLPGRITAAFGSAWSRGVRPCWVCSALASQAGAFAGSCWGAAALSPGTSPSAPSDVAVVAGGAVVVVADGSAGAVVAVVSPGAVVVVEPVTPLPPASQSL